MAQIFISYSRRDKEFVRKLADALEARKRTVWADWKDIPLTSEWLKEILKNIEAADCFLFILSPDSAASRNCGDELDHAVANNKKMLPVLCRAVHGVEVPKKISKYQRIEFLRDEEFDARVDELLRAVDTDLEWVEQHTRLLTRAREWEHEQRDSSFLLRGKDLAEAEQALVKGANHDPKPTALQSEYVLAGRQNATRRQRLVFQGVTVALVVAVGLAVYSLLERNKAVRNAREAEARAQAALSAASLNDDPELGILLAMQAMGATMRFGEPPLASAEQALHEALFSSQLRKTLPGPGGPVHGAKFSPDGTLMAMANNDGSVWLMDAASGRNVRTVPAHHAGPRDAGKGWSLDFSPDGKEIATGNDDGTASVWNLVTGKERLVLAGHAGRVRSVVFRGDGGQLVTAGDDGKAIVWDVSDGKKLRTIETGHAVHAAALSPVDSLLATAGTGETLLWDPSTGRRIASLSSIDHFDVQCLAFSPHGDRLATGLDNGTTELWSMSSGQRIAELRGPYHAVMGVAFSPDGNSLATTGWDGIPRVWNAHSYLLVGAMQFHREVVVRSYSVSFSNDGRSLLTSHEDGSIRLWNAGIGEELPSLNPHGRTLHVAYSADGGDLAVIGDFGLSLWKVATAQEEENRPCFQTETRGLAFSRNGKKVARSRFGDVVICDLKTGEETAMGGDPGAWMGLAVNADGTRIAASDGLGGAILWDASTGGQLWHQVDPTRHANADARAVVDDAAFSPDGKLLATGSSEHKLVLWDAPTGKRLWEKECHNFSDGVWAVAFSPDGRRLASAGADNAVIVWDVSSGNPLFTIRPGGGTVTDVAFSPDGRQIATSSADHRAKVWDARTGDELLTLRGPDNNMFAVAFSPDGKRLAAGNATGAVQIYDLDIHDLLNLARTRVTRNLTAAECRYYLREKSCPALPQ